ncbi:MAG: TraR/DksA family transcriptional regulator [Planctomycetota bacterium]
MAKNRKKTKKKKTSSPRTKKSRLSAANIEHFKQLLLQKRREIISNVNEMEDEALKQSRLDASGDLSSMPIHMADIGTDNYEQEFALGLMDSERKLLRETDDALQRIEQGTYGICEGTGKQIRKARLEAQPWARYCVEYARMLEQGLVKEQEGPRLELQDYGSENNFEE